MSCQRRTGIQKRQEEAQWGVPNMIKNILRVREGIKFPKDSVMKRIADETKSRMRHMLLARAPGS